VRQVLTNLLTNAHQYTGDGGRIAVRAAAVDGSVTIEVADTGHGMTPEELDRVFERFSRGASAGMGVPGTGLGLAIVRSLVDLQDGSISVESQPGAGTTFTVRLPRAPERPALDGRRVLVVDDDAEAASAIARRLEAVGVEAVIARERSRAVACLREQRFDAMTLDVLMAGASGFEVLREVRADPQLRDLPVVVLSALGPREALSGEWVVAKPIDADELVEALGAAMLVGRVRVLAVGRPEVRDRLAATLDQLKIEFEWVTRAEDAAARAGAGWFEVALVDAGMDGAHHAIDGLRLRGRRLRRAVVVFSVGDDAPGLARLDPVPVAVEQAGAAVLALLEAHAGTEVGG
jgi:CheY-like chemotaxis protein/anti-sigma regulatory factor (Ser/Thr protein kinase)